VVWVVVLGIAVEVVKESVVDVVVKVWVTLLNCKLVRIWICTDVIVTVVAFATEVPVKTVFVDVCW
jgi:hypothetical protein